MNKVFADTSFYVALFAEHDRWHQQASRLFSQIDGPVVTSEYVLVELGAIMRGESRRSVFVRFVHDLATDQNAQVIPATSGLLQEGVKLFGERLDKQWSLTDCISFVIMKKHEISDALTSDRHFEQAGFRILLSN